MVTAQSSAAGSSMASSTLPSSSDEKPSSPSLVEELARLAFFAVSSSSLSPEALGSWCLRLPEAKVCLVEIGGFDIC